MMSPLLSMVMKKGESLKHLSGKTFRGKELTFSVESRNFPNSLVDSDGNVWSVLGEGVSQDVANSKLGSVNHLVGYWFLFPAFFDNVQLSNGAVIQKTP